MFIQIEKGTGSYASQIYEQIRAKILSGELAAGKKLTSSRALSDQLRVSRNTVMTAYDMLGAEGLISGVSGSGVYVAEGVKLVRTSGPIGDYSVTAFSDGRLDGDMVAFHSGTPALDRFPRAKWSRAVSRAFADAPDSALGYDEPLGRPELRQALAAYLKQTRGIGCDSGQILVTSGAKQGLTLVAKCLLGEGAQVCLEDPGNANVLKIFSYHTRNIEPVAVDAQGLRTDLLPQGNHPTLVFVTPSHQFPMGGVLPAKRRVELVRYAQKTGCWLVEDDYDSEFRYDGLPIRSLRELCPDRVIYVGTFSKVLFPSLRLGYLVLPPALVGTFREWKRLGDHHCNSIDQLALTAFLQSGDLQRHVAKMRRLYARRRDELIALLQESFADRVCVLGDSAGMHVVAEFAGVEFTDELTARLRQQGVDVLPVEAHAIGKGRHVGQVILGYAHLSREQMALGLSRLAAALDSQRLCL